MAHPKDYVLIKAYGIFYRKTPLQIAHACRRAALAGKSEHSAYWMDSEGMVVGMDSLDARDASHIEMIASIL